MIKVTNICPVCETESDFEFYDDFRGDDFPEDGHWGVPCSICEDGLAKALNSNKAEDGNREFLELHDGCLHKNHESIAMARNLISQQTEAV